MTSVTKSRLTSIKNHESNVFNESGELLSFYGSADIRSSNFENLGSNKRITATYSIVPEVNMRYKSVTVNSLHNEYFDDENTKTINVIEDLNPKVSIGISSKINSQNLEAYESRFDNVTDIENVSIRLINNDDSIYPYLVDINAHEIEKKGSCLDPFNIYKEISRDIITEFNEKGAKALTSLSGALDCRKRSVQISNFHYKYNKNIEPYDDHGEPDDIMSVFRQQEYYESNFIEASFVNNREVLSINTNKKRFKPVTSKETRYFSNENNFIEPFVEKDIEITNDESYISKKENRFYLKSDVLKDFFLNKDKTIMKNTYNNNIKSDIKYSSFGFSSDYSKTHGVDSISFRGLIK